ncbi:MAG: ABC transporter permease [Anaerolineae bacterium]|nr:ABC transporter permease [Anaerolineae bacterium]
MRRYIGRRIFQAMPTLLLLTVITFSFMQLAPGDFVDAMIDPAALTANSKELLAQQRAALGIDQPVVIQYVNWVGQLVQGNLGYSFVYKRPVLQMIAERLWATMQLGGAAIIVAVILGVLAGIVSGLRPYSTFDYVVSVLSYGAWSFPNFYLGLILIYVFAVQLKILPSAGMLTPGIDDFGNRLKHLILPVTALSVQFIGLFARQTRSAILEVRAEEYINTAHAKGLRPRRVTLRHILPNALIPIITVIGLSLPVLITGAIVTETVFSWSGMGTLMLNAITARDYPVVMGTVLAVGVVVLLVNLGVDVLYAVVDPRSRYN